MEVSVNKSLIACMLLCGMAHTGITLSSESKDISTSTAQPSESNGIKTPEALASTPAPIIYTDMLKDMAKASITGAGNASLWIIKNPTDTLKIAGAVAIVGFLFSERFRTFTITHTMPNWLVKWFGYNTQVDEKLNELTAQMATIQEQLHKLSSDGSQNTELLNSLSAQLQAINAAIEDLQTTTQATQTKIDELTAQVQENHTAIMAKLEEITAQKPQLQSIANTPTENLSRFARMGGK
jgi:archaellum component FlaC